MTAATTTDLSHLVADSGQPGGPWHWLILLIGAALLAQTVGGGGAEMIRPSARLARPPRPPVERLVRKGD